MSRRALVVMLTVCALAAAHGSAGAAGDAKAGRTKAIMCTGCHNNAGMRINRPQIYRIPKIAGQHASYIETALQGYKSGARKNETMRALTAPLSEQDIQDLAAYFASQTWD